MSAPFSLLGDNLPTWLARRVVGIAPGACLAYDETAWHNAVVVLERGSLVLITVNGVRLRLPEGAVLCLAGLHLAALHNPGPTPTVIAVARRTTR